MTSFGRRLTVLVLFLMAALLGAVGGALLAYTDDLPEITVLDNYRPNTITRLTSVDGTVIACPVESLCLHGDTPGAVELVTKVRESLHTAGIRLSPFSRRS